VQRYFLITLYILRIQYVYFLQPHMSSIGIDKQNVVTNPRTPRKCTVLIGSFVFDLRYFFGKVHWRKRDQLVCKLNIKYTGRLSSNITDNVPTVFIPTYCTLCTTYKLLQPVSTNIFSHLQFIFNYIYLSDEYLGKLYNSKLITVCSYATGSDVKDSGQN
jgi:hypothetical protein